MWVINKCWHVLMVCAQNFLRAASSRLELKALVASEMKVLSAKIHPVQPLICETRTLRLSMVSRPAHPALIPLTNLV